VCSTWRAISEERDHFLTLLTKDWYQMHGIFNGRYTPTFNSFFFGLTYVDIVCLITSRPSWTFRSIFFPKNYIHQVSICCRPWSPKKAQTYALRPFQWLKETIRKAFEKWLVAKILHSADTIQLHLESLEICCAGIIFFKYREEYRPLDVRRGLCLAWSFHYLTT
jgi:hypothetical protein